jgi:tetratricopeptide (TPR) repeat protein
MTAAWLWLASPVFAIDADDELLLPLPPATHTALPRPTLVPASFPLLHEGATLLANGHIAKAEEVLRAAVASYPDIPEAAYNLGLAQAFNGNFVEAERSHQLALQKNPRFAAAFLARGNALLALQRREEALDAFLQAEALAVDPETTAAAAFNSALALGKLNRFTEAEAVFIDCLARTPDDPAPAFQLGVLKMRQKKWQEALEWLEPVRTALPLETAILRSRAFVRLNRASEAASALAEAEKHITAGTLANDIRTSLQQVVRELRQELVDALPPKK